MIVTLSSSKGRAAVVRRFRVLRITYVLRTVIICGQLACYDRPGDPEDIRQTTESRASLRDPFETNAIDPNLALRAATAYVRDLGELRSFQAHIGIAAQYEAARRLLKSEGPPETKAPLILRGVHWKKEEDGEQRVYVEALSMNRGVYRVLFWFMMGLRKYVVCFEDRLEEKASSYVHSRGFLMKRLADNDMDRMAQEDEFGVHWVNCQEKSERTPEWDEIPWPQDEKTEVYVSVEDRNGMMSGCTRVYEVPRPRLTPISRERG